MQVVKDYRAIVESSQPGSSRSRANIPLDLGSLKVLTYRFGGWDPDDGLSPNVEGNESVARLYDQRKMDIVRECLDMIEAETGLCFVETDHDDASADVSLYAVNDPSNPWAGLAYIISGTENSQSNSTVMMNLSRAGDALSFKKTMIHELMHTVGFKHPHEGGEFLLEPSMDNKQTSVMSYNHANDYGPAKLGTLDREGLKHLYGTETMKEHGVKVDRVVGADGKAYIRIVTAGDGVEMTGSTSNNLFITGDGDDKLAGRQGDDLFYTGSGDDHILAGDGNDSIWSGSGNDLIVAGPGDDYIDAGTGKNVIDAGTGEDTIVLSGDDEVWTGGDSDLIIIKQKQTISRIKDFHGKEDRIEITAGSPDVLIAQADSMVHVHVSDGDVSHWLEISTTSTAEAIMGRLNFKDPDTGADLSWDYQMVDLADFPVTPDELPDVTEPEPNPDDGFSAAPEPDHPEQDESEDQQDHATASGGGCFVATAAYGSRNHPDVVSLRRFRDETLVRYKAGRAFIRFYWVVGPVLADKVSPDTWTGRTVRSLLRPLVSAITKK